MTDREKVARAIDPKAFEGPSSSFRFAQARGSTDEQITASWEHAVAPQRKAALEAADRVLAALRPEAPQDGVAEAAKVLLDIVERRAWTHYLIEMPITIDGKGPATIGEDANSMSYEVWQACDFFAVSDHGNLPDALESWLRALSQGAK